MPEHLRALVVILVLATLFFAFAQRFAIAIAKIEDFKFRRNLWFALTLAAFLASDFWLYLAIATPLLIYANRRESNPPALYFFILFVLPEATIQIPGMGLINFFFELTHARVLALLLLLPAFFVLRKQSDTLSFGRTAPDKALATYLLLTAILYFREESMTNSLRQIFYLFIDVFLPYFVISRWLKNLQVFRDAVLSMVLAIMLIAPFAMFEFTKGWILYSALIAKLDLGGGMTGYLARDGILRALVTAGQPIALGYLMVVGIGFYLFMQRSIKQNFSRRLGMALLVGGLVAPLSRGPWIGSLILLIIFIATGRYAMHRLMILALAAVLILPLVSILPGGERVINLLPFIGSTEKGNVDYREQLITNSMIVIDRNPWFGSNEFLDTPEMQAMRQGQGIIDIVNTYISVILEKGWIGLGIFVFIFILTLTGIYRAMRSLPDKGSEEYLLGQTLLATQISILVMIFTVSSITVIPIVYWSVAGLGVAYAQMISRNTI
jgi:hypothetical protein